ncbi:LPXTG cell wall anchor domain-containing protein [Agrococcus versicolor]|uniref:LPXTG cell wall anchor domain-containing protein n=1 Tax=Agrococcus versicolor TaxID=501482 RepID=UPI0031E00397
MLNHSLSHRPRALALAAMMLLTALLGALLVTMSAQPAQAHTPAAQASCGTLAVSATSYSGSAANHVTVVIDGETVVDEDFGQAFERTLTWSQSFDHDWSVTIDQGDGDQFDFEQSGTQVACQPAPPTTVTAVPTFQDVCGPEYQLTVPADGEGYRFSTDTSDLVGGSGEIVVTGTLQRGYVWDDGTTGVRTFRFDATSEPCTTTVDIPAAASGQDVCGPDYGVTAPQDTDAYVTTIDRSGVVDGAGTVVVTTTLNAGYVWSDGTTEPRTWSVTVTNEPCDTPVAGIASAGIVVTPPTCDAPGTATTGETERASWTVTDVPAAGGTATFVATAEEGAAFEAGLPGVSADLVTRTFTVDVPAADAGLCSIAPPPVQPPTQVTPPVTPPQSSAPTLPRTGFDVSSILVLGALLAMAGTALVVRRVRADA